MINSTKEQIGCDVICKSHSARTERDLYRICPSKLNKRELEDLYFALLENNLELKKTINIQQDKVKVLSTKLQRMTVAHKHVVGKDDCCASKAVISAQKESITDLKKTNERMAERIRLLNMRLCSAKQFLKRSPSQATNSKNNCARCSFKISSMSALNAKRSDSNMRSTAVSCQFLDKDVPEKEMRTVETETEISPEKEVTEKPCNENRCRTTMDELKEKIVNLQEELGSSHGEYSQRIAKLESQVSELQDENLRVRSERVASEHALQHRQRKEDQLLDKLRTADAKCNELNMELLIEKRKVTELETGLKLASMTNSVANTIEQLATAQEVKEASPEQSLCRPCSSAGSQRNVQLIVAPSKANLELPSSSKAYDEVKTSKSDDSGYTELNKSCETEEDQAMVKMNRELLEKVAELQTQLDLLRISAAGIAESEENKKPKEFESYDAETRDINEVPIKISEDSATMLMGTELYEVDAATSKPWKDYVPKRNGNMQESVDKDNDPTKIAIKCKSEAKVIHDDDHNSFIIPSSSPVVCPSPTCPKDKKKTFRRASQDSYTENPKNKKHSDEKTVKIIEDREEGYEKPSKEIESAFIKAKNSVIAHLKELKDGEDERKNAVEKRQKNVSITDQEPRQNEQAKLADRTPTRDSIFVNRKKLLSQSAENESAMEEVKKESMTSFYFDSVCTPPISENLVKTKQEEKNADTQYALCESRVRVCRCPALERRDVAVFRSCSGTLRFRTTAAGDKLRHCACQVLADSGTETDSPPAPHVRDSATYTASAPHTYTVQEKRERATSPENTEHEISSLTDLPSEKDAKSPRAVFSSGESPRAVLSPGESPRAVLSPGESPRATFSPGEERGTMTYTDTETMATDYGSLSEGEMPTGGKARRLSAGERVSPSAYAMPQLTSSEKMEATLQNISEELARCRQLLLTQKPLENIGALQSSIEKSGEIEHALRPSAGNRSIANKRAPSCVFILHIGTMVLSDEFMVFVRDKSLVLLWKFHSQSTAMMRVHSGRIVQFDFVSEYDVSFNDDFLDYMKHSDMNLMLCEVDKQNEPLAICSLPLREALLQANRRADMSLALIPPSSFGISRASVGDEIGVLDLWCTLRVDVSLLPTIHRAMHTPSSRDWVNMNPMCSDSKAIQQAVEDEMSGSSERLSRDLELSHPGASNKQGHADSQSKAPGLLTQKSNRPDEEYQSTIPRSPSSRYDDYVQQYRPSRPYRRRSSQTHHSIPASPATITSSVEMKQALERNVQQNNFPVLPKMDEDAYHIHSSVGSVKSLAAKHQLSKLRWSKKVSKERADSLQEKPDKEALSVPGIDKLAEASKKSVKYTDAPFHEEPHKENSADSDDIGESIDITILWLALNEECEAMLNSRVQRLYVAYSFLGRRGADLETPFSLPKPKHYADKCYFNYKKTFHLHECDLPLLGHMSRCRAGGGASTDPRDCIVFTLVSEPPEDPLGLSSCEDIGYAYLYLGDVLAYSGDSGGYTEVVGVRGARGGVCGVLAVRVDRLPVLRRCLSLSHSHRDLTRAID